MNIDTHDRSGLLERVENLEKFAASFPTAYEATENLRRFLSIKEKEACFICFEKECVCKPRS